MKNLALVMMGWLIIGQLSAQNISGGEYFFDSDPGVGNGVAIPLSPALVQNVSFAIDISDLEPGFHSMYVRAKQDGVWGPYGQKRTFYISVLISPEDIETNITASEYFFDTDPGVGNGVAIPISAGPVQDVSFAIDISDLEPGFHSLYVRAKQGEVWGPYGQKRTFYISVSESPGDIETNITASEYFFDTDPGVGNGVAIPISAGPVQDVSFAIDISDLEPGFHSLYVRAKQGEVWGPHGQKRTFYISVSESPGDIETNITASEYFFDTDPGVGNGVAIPISVGPVQDVSFAIDISDLEPGFHSLYVRAKQGEVWGPYGQKRTFYINDNNDGVLVPSEINNIEYFIDNDPGIGNGTIVDITDGYEISEIITANLPSLEYGTHILHLRAITTAGITGFYKSKSFTVCETGVLSPDLSQSIVPDCENEAFSVQISLPESWDGPAYLISNDFNTQTQTLAAGESFVFGPFASESNVLFSGDDNGGDIFCPVVQYATYTCYDCQELEVNNGDVCEQSGEQGAYEDCVCVIIPIDCNGVENGLALIDECGVCSGGDTGLVPNQSCTDCEGTINGDALPESLCYIGDEIGIYNADCECIISELGNIQGTVGGLIECGLRTISLGFYNQLYPELNEVYTATLDENGAFSSPSYIVGVYDILITVQGYLSQLYSDVTIESETNELEVSGIIVGDLNASNGVNISDFSILNNAFGSSDGDANYNYLADMNCDGLVNIIDISILNLNFGLIGDSPPSND